MKVRTFNKTYTKNDKFDINKISDEDWEIISNENMIFYKEQISRIKKSGLLPKENKTTNKEVIFKMKKIKN